MSDAGAMQRPRGIAPPRGTWVCMLLALVLALLLSPLTTLVSDRLGNQTLWPLAMLATVVLLGAAGAVFALRRARYGWTAVSLLWGPFLLQAGYIVVVMIWGP